jgi:phage shock protein PspC (stress-responsive transcriptional regulator)
MYRSFPNRILGGVCGGLAVDLHVNVWFLRVTFLIMVVVGQGAAVVMYLILWWIMPQETLIGDRKRSIWRLLVVATIIVLVVGIWLGHQTGSIVGPSGQNVFVPAILLLMSVVFLMRQLRG